MKERNGERDASILMSDDDQIDQGKQQGRVG